MSGLAQECEVLVIGAGPAGASAALTAAAGGADVIMIERRRQVGVPAQCAGFVPAAALAPSSLPRGVIVQRIRRMTTVTPDGASASIASPGFMVRRELLDQALAGQAARAGVRVMTGVSARAITASSRGKIILEAGARSAGASLASGGRGIIIGTRRLVGADGPQSLAGRFMCSRNRELLAGAQWTVPLTGASEEIRIYFDRRLPGGYGWLFPMELRANAGVAVSRGVGVKPALALQWFLDKLAAEGLIQARRDSATGGLIPVGGPLQVAAGGVLLAGDAAGFCHPLTGAGIAMAMQSGAMAGEAAAASLQGRGDAAISGYQAEIEGSIAPVLSRALIARGRLYRNQGGARSDFCRSIRRDWIGFLPD